MRRKNCKPFYHAVISLDPIIRLLFNVRIEGSFPVSEWQGGLIASNHISYLDPPIVAFCLPIEIYFLAKSDLFKIPGLGWLIRNLNAIPIRRGSIDRAATESGKAVLQAGNSLLVFPEGSRKSFTAKPGIGQLAIQTSSRIIPVRIENSNHPFACMFRLRKMRVIFGNPIERDIVQQNPDTKDGYRALAEYVLKEINGLGQ
jgi:1-acyl-sn-glycerol-3-phosphate acyltransferase